MDSDRAEKSWERFQSRHLGDWTGRAIVLNGKDGQIVSAKSYELKTESVTSSRNNKTRMLVTSSVRIEQGQQNEFGDEQPVTLCYSLDDFYVFPDGSYSADTRVLDLGPLIGVTDKVAAFAIEYALPISSTERVRAFALYGPHFLGSSDPVHPAANIADEDSADEAPPAETWDLHTILLLEEARAGDFDTRPPLSVTAMIGSWIGSAETWRHDPDSIVLPRRPDYDEDVPLPLRHSSSSKEGLIVTKTCVEMGWDPTTSAVRRTTTLKEGGDKGKPMGSTSVYGTVTAPEKSMFDMLCFGDGSVMCLLSNGCFLQVPSKAPGLCDAVTSEFGCLVTPAFRRRVSRVYNASGTVASETLAAESLGD